MPLPHCADLQATAPDGHTRPRRFGSNEGSKKSRCHVILYLLVAVFLLPFSALSDRSKRPSLGKDNAKIRELISRKHFTAAANLITAEAWLVKVTSICEMTHEEGAIGLCRGEETTQRIK